MQRSLYPYACIQQLPSLLEAKSVLVGVTNSMMAMHPSLAHVTVDLCNAKGHLAVRYGVSSADSVQGCIIHWVPVT